MTSIARAFLPSEPQPLTMAIAARHRFDWASRVDVNDLHRTLSVYPGRSSWIPDADEFIVVAPWRHREEISSVASVSAVRRVDDLISASRAASFELGADAFVIPEWSETRNPRFYARNGLDLWEDVISFEIDASASRPGDLERGNPLRLVSASSPLLDEIMAIDHAAFPWLWRNVRLEFEEYLVTPGVEVWAFRDATGVPVGYVGITSYSGWGHLDRVAVAPARQGEGHGLGAVRFAIARLQRLGARRVGLSTQRSNARSQRLYLGIGFQQTWQNDYRIYGTLAPGIRLDGSRE